MRSYFLTILTILLYFSASSQSLKPDQLIGEWTVKSTQLTADMLAEMNLTQEQLKRMESFRNECTGMHFIFKADQSFQTKVPKNMSNSLKEMFLMEPAKWKLSTQEGHVLIGTTKDKFTLGEFIVIQQPGSTYFQIEGTPFLFEVSK